MIDIENYTESADETAILELTDPSTGAPIQDSKGESIYIELYGYDSTVFRNAKNRIMNKRIGKKKIVDTAEATESDNAELLAACTVSWAGIAKGGELLECTPANVKMVYLNVNWIKEQVDDFVGDRGNFFKK